MSLDAIDIEGYKSIRSAKIELGPINVLIGANGAGKSNLLGVFNLLADIADHRLQLHVGRAGGANTILHFGSKQTSSLRLDLRFGQRGYEAILVPNDDDSFIFGTELSKHWSGLNPVRLDQEVYIAPGTKETSLSEASEHAIPVLTAMRSWRRFHFHDTGRTAPLRQKQKIDDNRVLRSEGENLAPFLYALRKTAPDAYRRIVESVRAVAPFFDDFVLEPDIVNPDVIQLAWRHKSDDALFTVASLSDGTIRFIALATLLFQPTLPSLIIIDEPELGLHPFAITQFAALVRYAASKSQLLLATQSVTLLDQFSPGEVIVTERNKDESVFRRLHEEDLVAWRDEYSLGDLWLKNVLGGRPR